MYEEVCAAIPRRMPFIYANSINFPVCLEYSSQNSSYYIRKKNVNGDEVQWKLET